MLANLLTIGFSAENDPLKLADYSGRINAAMFRKWRDLAIDANGVAQ